MAPPRADVAGVYRIEPGGGRVLVHAYEDEATELADIATLLDLGTPGDDGAALRLTRHELKLLEVAAHAQSFDHPPEFIRMCLDVAGQALAPDRDAVELVSAG